MDVNDSLMSAVRFGDLKRVRELINILLCDLRSVPKGYDLLYDAIYTKHRDVAKLLLTNNIDVIGNYKYNTLFHIAIKSGDIEIVKMLLDRNANIEAIDDAGNTPLSIAVIEGHKKIIEVLLKRGANIEAKNKRGDTPLHISIQNDRKDIAKLLVNKGANIENINTHGKTPLYLAIEGDCLQCVEFLLKRGAYINSPQTSPLNLVIKKGRGGQQICSKKLRMTSKLSTSPVHTAARHKREKAFLLLVKYGADVNAKDEYGKTPICYAIEQSDLKFIKMLLACGANANDTNLLNHAIIMKNREIVDFFLKQYTNINGIDDNGMLALHCVLSGTLPDKKFREEIAKLILSKGADVNAENEDGETPLHISSVNGYEEITEILLKKGANVNVKRRLHGTTPLHCATRNGHKNIVELLLKYGASVDSMELTAYPTPLHIAAVAGYLEIVQILLKFGANINYIDDCFGRSALHYACENGHPQVVAALLEHGCDVNIMSDRKFTPLNSAIISFGVFRNQVEMDSFGEAAVVNMLGCGQAVEILKQHIVKMKTLNLYVSRENLLSLILDGGVDEFSNACELEIKCMKKEKIGDSNVSFYDILMKDTNLLALYARNEQVVQVLESDYCKTRFPIYANMIGKNFEKALGKSFIIEQGRKSLHRLFKDSTELPHTCIERILIYLDDKDLTVLSDCFHT